MRLYCHSVTVSPDRMRRTTLWRRSLACPSTRTTRPSQCRRCQRKPPLANCLALWTSSWTTTWWTWSNQETECRLLGRTAACPARRTASPPARSGEVEQSVCGGSSARLHDPQLIFLTLFPPRTIMIACNVKQMSKEVSPFFSADDVAKIRNFSQTRSKVPFQPFCLILTLNIRETKSSSFSGLYTGCV